MEGNLYMWLIKNKHYFWWIVINWIEYLQIRIEWVVPTPRNRPPQTAFKHRLADQPRLWWSAVCRWGHNTLKLMSVQSWRCLILCRVQVSEALCSPPPPNSNTTPPPPVESSRRLLLALSGLEISLIVWLLWIRTADWKSLRLAEQMATIHPCGPRPRVSPSLFELGHQRARQLSIWC